MALARGARADPRLAQRGGRVTRLVARDCGCTTEFFAGQKRPRTCDCGHLYERPEVVEARTERRRSKPRRRHSEPRRDWDAAIAKRDAEGCCRVCGATTNLEAAHVMGREHDEPAHPGSRVLYVAPARIFVLCGPFPAGCHGDFDHHRLDVLHLLTADEQAQAVADAGGIEQARRRLLPSAYTHERVTEAGA